MMSESNDRKKCGEHCIAAWTTGKSITTIMSGETTTGAWNCANCWKCVEACPDEDVYGYMMERRRQEEPPARYKRSYDSIRACGYSFPVEELNAIREMWGLKKIKLVNPEIVRKLLG